MKEFTMFSLNSFRNDIRNQIYPEQLKTLDNIIDSLTWIRYERE